MANQAPNEPGVATDEPGLTDPTVTEAEAASGRADESDADELPPFTEQLSEQLGGVRGIIESGIPVGVFVITNIVWEGGLRWAIAAAVVVALTIAGMRAFRGEPVRHAINGLFGIGLGAWLAWRSGETRDFYLPGIIQGAVTGLALLGSVLVRHPLVGWFWSVIAGGGKAQWRDNPRLVRVFSWLTVLWGAVFLVKNAARWWLYELDLDNVLGVVTLLGGYPVTAVLVIITLWTIRRVHPKEPAEPVEPVAETA